MEYRGMQKADEPFVRCLYYNLNEKKRSIVGARRLLYRWFGSRLIMLGVVRKNSNAFSRIVAIDMYYFNRRDLREGTIHEGFVGVELGFEGKGVATMMRRLALEHFTTSGLSGVSSRISLNNKGSLRSAENLGFKSVEKYYDDVLKEWRGYFVAGLDSKDE